MPQPLEALLHRRPDETARTNEEKRTESCEAQNYAGGIAYPGTKRPPKVNPSPEKPKKKKKEKENRYFSHKRISGGLLFARLYLSFLFFFSFFRCWGKKTSNAPITVVQTTVASSALDSADPMACAKKSVPWNKETKKREKKMKGNQKLETIIIPTSPVLFLAK
jgi:hypothetical protein